MSTKLTKKEIGEAFDEGIFCPGDTRAVLKKRRYLKSLEAAEHIYLAEACYVDFYFKEIKTLQKDLLKLAKATFKIDSSIQTYSIKNEKIGFEISISQEELLECGILKKSSSSSSPSSSLSSSQPLSLIKAKELFIKKFIESSKKTIPGLSKVVLQNQALNAWEKLSESEKQSWRNKK